MGYSKNYRSYFKAALLICVLFIACGCESQPKIVIAASSVPHAQMLELIQPQLLAQGVKIEIVVMDDYHVPNRLLHEKHIDANFFQHTLFLDEQSKHFGYDLKVVAPIHIEPLGVYSLKKCSVPQGKVAIPSDPTNEARALCLLHNQGWITLDQDSFKHATIHDIVLNPFALTFIEVDVPMLPRVLHDVEYAVIPAHSALQAKLLDVTDPLYIEEDALYANVLVVRAQEDRKEIELIVQALQSDVVAQFLNQHYPLIKLKSKN